MRTQVLVYLVVGTVACSICSGQTQPFFQGLGDLPGGVFQSQAFGISADGTTVVGRGTSAQGGEAFMWTKAGGMVAMGDLPGGDFFSIAYGVSADGTIVVGQSISFNGYESFRWSKQTGMIGLGDIATGSGNNWANAVSADGSVIVGTASTPAGLQAYRWTPATGMLGLGYLPGAFPTHSRATGVSLDGLVLASPSYSACSGDGYEPALWTPGGGMQALGGLPGQRCNGFAYGVSPDGSVIVGWTLPFNSPTHAFRWMAQTGMVSLGRTPQGASGHGAVSENGEVVVGDTFSSSDNVFIWREGVGMRGLQSILTNEFGLNVVGWELWEGRGISADGRTIVGFGRNPAGDREGWIAHLGDTCYADCDQSTGAGVLDLFDFLCFQGSFVGGEPYACDCDTSTGPLVCDLFDFLCFQNAFVGECP